MRIKKEISENSLFYIYTILTIIYASVILYMSLSPRPPGADVGRKTVPYFTYLSHMGMYFLLSTSLYVTMKEGGFFNEKLLSVVVFSSFLYGLVIEILQLLVPGRFFSIFDLIMNGVGCLLFLALVKLYHMVSR